MELVKVIYPKGKTDGLLALGSFQVGHVYEVDKKTADELIAAGFELDEAQRKSDTADASTASAQPAAGAKK